MGLFDSGIGGFFSGIGDGIASVFGGIKDTAVNIFNEGKNIVGGLLGGVKDVVNNVVAAPSNLVGKVVDKGGDVIKAVSGDIKQTVVGAAKEVGGAVEGFGSSLSIPLAIAAGVVALVVLGKK